MGKSRNRVLGSTIFLTLAGLTLASCSTRTAPPGGGPQPPSALASPATPSLLSPTPTRGDFAGRFDIGGRKLFLSCRGRGENVPTVILQSGFGNSGDIWEAAGKPPPVARILEKTTRVCIYDRPGSVLAADPPEPGRSDMVNMPRTAEDVVDELHALLQAAHVRGPYVLAGHSLGSIFNYAYARSYPNDVLGLVSVDGTPPPLKELLSPKNWKASVQDPLMQSSPGGEAYDVDKSLKQIANLPPLRPIPLTVLVAGKAEILPPDAPPDFRVAYLAAREVWPMAQKEFAEQSPKGRLVTVKGASHYIHTQKPSVVADAVKRVIADASAYGSGK